MNCHGIVIRLKIKKNSISKKITVTHCDWRAIFKAFNEKNGLLPNLKRG